ncbi:NACHT domain-containing protein [Sphingopyxis terrae]|uniref:NACHT domain-containing protein n=1 Tax=Sphingopyxis terrae TaxID=33052 RepID=UPI002A0AD3B8|nr:type I restriction enzyme HsdR N-terminal domain-containing protein [Sphingopyxis terrae]MDX8357753.1 type I restriction enzyme HsdR N-terminal domain-containing protein [Sphingopyxis terrae]
MEIVLSEDAKDAIWSEITVAAPKREADVEQWLILPLLRALGYRDADIRAKAPVVFQEGRQGRPHEADYVIYYGPVHTREYSLIVVEAKKPSEALSPGLKQAESYAFNLRAPFLLLTNGVAFEIWQLQPTRESVKTFEAPVASLATHRGRIEELISREAAAQHCRQLDLKPLPQASGIFAAYEEAELSRHANEGIARTIKGPETEAPALSIRSLLNDGALIHAPSGFGKSTLVADLRHAALLERASDPTRPLAIEIPMPDLEVSGQSIVEFARERVKAHAPAVTKEAFLTALRDQGAVFLCDAFDRVASSRRAVIEADLRNLRRDYPKVELLVVDRSPVGERLGLPNWELLKLDYQQQVELTDRLAPSRHASVRYSLPKLLDNLAEHPLLLTLMVEHYVKNGDYPQRLGVLFESWLETLLERSARTVSEFETLRAALTTVAAATADGPVPPAQALSALAESGHAGADLDRLTALGAVLAARLVEVRHEALADFLRAGAFFDAATGDPVQMASALRIEPGSMFPAFLIEGATSLPVQRAIWQRLSITSFTSYADALRYRGDLSSDFQAGEEGEHSRLFAEEFMRGFAEPLEGFFAPLAEILTRELAGETASRIAVHGTLVDDGNGFIYSFAPPGDGDASVTVGFPVGGHHYQNLARTGIRADGGRLLGFARLVKEIRALVKKRWLIGGTEFANERLIARLHFLQEAYDFPLAGVAGFDEIETMLEPHREQFAGNNFGSETAFYIAEMFDDIAQLRAASRTAVERWWLQYGPFSLEEPENAKRLVAEYWTRAQRIYAEIAEHSFPRLRAELAQYCALPLRYEVRLCMSKHHGASWHYRWLPVATWPEAGADVEISDERLSVGDEGFRERAQIAFARLRRPGIVALSSGMSGVPDFSGYDWKGLFDGETPPFRLAFEMLKHDLNRLVERAPSRDGAAEDPLFLD